MKIVSVIGAGRASEDIWDAAFKAGELAASYGFAVATGGLGGVMTAALKGAKQNGGLTIGILPTYMKEEANEYCSLVIPTGLGHGRNVVLVSTGDIVVSVGGEYGTLNEIGIALKMGRTLVSYKSPYEGVQSCDLIETFLTNCQTHMERIC